MVATGRLVGWDLLEISLRKHHRAVKASVDYQKTAVFYCAEFCFLSGYKHQDVLRVAA
jgi:hypothetical protein